MFKNAQWFLFDSVGSTNTCAQEIAGEKALPEGSVIMANFQKRGKGQRGSTWQSQHGENILMSTVLYPVFLPSTKLFCLSKAIALAVSDLAEEVGVDNISIKWPNDIYAGNKKLAGILIENTFRSTEIAMTVAGTGVNVNQTHFSDNIKSATSLNIETGKKLEIKHAAELLHKHVSYWYSQLKQGNLKLIDSTYHQRLYRLNTKAPFRENGTEFTGTIKGVNESGKLVIENKTGEMLEFDLKEVEFVI